MSGVYVQGKCVIAIESRFGSKGNQGKSIESGCGSKGNPSSQDLGARDIHRVKVWQQGLPSSQGLGARRVPSSQACAAGIARFILGYFGFATQASGNRIAKAGIHL